MVDNSGILKAHRSMSTKHIYARLLLHKVFCNKLCVVLLDFWLLVFVSVLDYMFSMVVNW